MTKEKRIGVLQNCTLSTLYKTGENSMVKFKTGSIINKTKQIINFNLLYIKRQAQKDEIEYGNK